MATYNLPGGKIYDDKTGITSSGQAPTQASTPTMNQASYSTSQRGNAAPTVNFTPGYYYGIYVSTPEEFQKQDNPATRTNSGVNELGKAIQTAQPIPTVGTSPRIDTSQPSPASAPTPFSVQNISTQALDQLKSQGILNPTPTQIQEVMKDIYDPKPESRFEQGYKNAKASGQPAPQVGGVARGNVNSYLPSVNDNAASNNVFETDPYFSNLTKMMQDFLSPQEQRKSLTETYKKLTADAGIEGLNTELMNMKHVIEGSEDDIRNEITKAGGFATDSQVLALTSSRNKQLIKNFNNLQETVNAKKEYVNTLINLEEKDRDEVDKAFDRKMNVGFKLAELGQKMQDNARDSYNKIIDRIGYQGLYESTGGDPYYTSMIERSLGMKEGGLRSAALAPDLNLLLKDAQIKNIYSEIEKRQQDGVNGGLDPAQLIGYAQEYAANGKIPTGIPKGSFGVISQYAKELPKQKGQIISVSTGVTPTGNDTLQNGIGQVASAIDLAKQLKDLETKRYKGIIAGSIGGILGSDAQADYMNTRTQIIDLLARARSGAALTQDEEDRYSSMLPGRFSNPFFVFGQDPQKKIDNFINTLTSDINTKASTQGWAINGLTKVKTSAGEFTVGDIIDINGLKGRINADGSVTEIK